MTLLVMTSAGHAPGVTTTALGLTLGWPGPALLVDADRVPTQAVLAGFLKGEDPTRKGLWEVLSAHRERRPLAPVVDSASVELPGGPAGRRFLPGYANPGMVKLFGPAWAEFAGTLATRPGGVVVDAGAIGVQGLPSALAGVADHVVVVTRSSLVSLAALRLYLPLLEIESRERVSVMVLGAGRPYLAAEIAEQFGLTVTQPVEWAPEDAAVLSHGNAPRRGFGSGAYVRSLRRAAVALAEQVAGLRSRVGAPT